MKASTLSDNFRDHWVIYLIAMLASLVLSGWISLNETVINPDGICYLQTAANLESTSLKAVASLCDQAKWPFYSALIYGLAKISHITYLGAAWIIDGSLSLISVFAFMTLVYLLGGRQRVLWLAAGIAIFAHEFSSVREYIVRDHGFWAFYLVSLIALLQYFRQPSQFKACLWSFAILAATLFRIEGVMFLLFMPLFALALTELSLAKRAKLFLQLNAISLCAGAGLIIYLLTSHQELVHLGRLGEVNAQLNHGLYTLAENFQTAAKNMSQHVLSSYAANEAGIVLSLVLIVWYGFSVVTNISLIYTFLVLYAWFKKALPLDRSAQLALWSYILINVLVTAVYLAENFFISKRYLIALAFTLMLWVPFALEKVIQTRQQNKLFFSMVVVLLGINAVSGIVHFGYSKDYLRHAGDWLSYNVPDQAVLYSNDEQVMYYSHHFGNDIFAKSKQFADMSAITAGQWQHYDYLAIRFAKHEAEYNTLLKELHATPVKVFANKRGDKVLIYKIDHQEIKS